MPVKFLNSVQYFCHPPVHNWLLIDFLLRATDATKLHTRHFHLPPHRLCTMPPKTRKPPQSPYLVYEQWRWPYLPAFLRSRNQHENLELETLHRWLCLEHRRKARQPKKKESRPQCRTTIIRRHLNQQKRQGSRKKSRGRRLLFGRWGGYRYR